MSTPNDPTGQSNPYGGQAGDNSNPYQGGQPYGGAPQQPYQQQPYGGQPGQTLPPSGQKSKIAAGVLGILLGYLGVHNFYLGYTGKAVTQLVLTLLVFTSPISAIWGLVEGILILVSKPGDQWHRDARGFELQD